MNILISNKWDGFLEKFPVEKKDIYYLESYTKLYENIEKTAQCIICVENNNVLLMPFLKRKVYEFFDFETAYGYGGPIANTEDQEWIEKALQGMWEYLRIERFLCGFIRFHPLLQNSLYCGNIIKTIPNRHTVAVSLCQSEEEIWKSQITSKNRNMIRKAEKLGLEYTAEDDFASIKDFIILYNKTMERLSAERFYYFEDSYYNEYISQMNGRGFLGTVRLEGKVISAALFMYSEQYGHYHLAGSDKTYASYGVNNFLLWNTIKELKKRKIKEFHLGGGAGEAEDDSLLKFKKSFSKDEKDFYIGKCIFNQEAYVDICQKWEKKHPELVPIYGNRLLKYRYEESAL